MFDGSLGQWKDKPCEMKLKDNVEFHHAKAFLVLHDCEATPKMEVEHLCKIGMLRRVNHSEWASPSSTIPKKDGTVGLTNDFRELNEYIMRTMPHHAIPKI